MRKKSVFFSFHYSNDVFRVQLIRNIGAIDKNTLVNPNEWEKIKLLGDRSIENWIDNNMKYKNCVVVLIGEHTYNRKWVNYEIRKAWDSYKPVIGIYIHNLKCPRNGLSKKGRNPFSSIPLTSGGYLSDYVPCYDPNPHRAYMDIQENIVSWIETAAKRGH